MITTTMTTTGTSGVRVVVIMRAVSIPKVTRVTIKVTRVIIKVTKFAMMKMGIPTMRGLNRVMRMHSNQPPLVMLMV